MRLYYISPRDVRKNRADPVHIMLSCKMFVKYGWKVKLVTPFVKRQEWKTTKSEIWGLYNISPCFEIIELPTFINEESNSISNQPMFIRISKLIIFSFYYIINLRKLNTNSVLYGKCYIGLFPAILLRKLKVLKAAIFFEKAEFIPKSKWHKFICRNVDGIIAINEFIRSNVEKNYKIDSSGLIKLPFASQTNFISSISKTKARKKLKLDIDVRYVTYAGKIGKSSLEIKYIIDAIEKEKIKSVVFLIVGGTEANISYWKNVCNSGNINNIEFKGYQTLENYYLYVAASDILISYYDSFDKMSVTQRVPGKMCVYTSSAKPIILADLPSMREWWTEKEVYFVPPDKPALLASKIKYVLSHPEEAKAKAAACKSFAEKNTYENSYREISRFIISISKKKQVN